MNNEDDTCLLCRKLHPPVVVVHASPEDSAEMWASDTAALVRALTDLYSMAHGGATVSRKQLAELARGCSEHLPPDGSLMARCVAKLESVNHDFGKYGRLSELAGTDPDRLGLLAASIYGVLEGLEGVT